MQSKKLFWGKTPFLVPKTEEVKDGYNNEGLTEQGYVYLTPVDGKKSKNGKPAYEQKNFTLEIGQGYIKDEHIIFQPQKAGDFHGTGFAFNRPNSEGKDEQVEQQNRLLADWAKQGCVCILDCREHHQLNQLAKDFDGYYIKSGNLMILTESTPMDKMPENEKKLYDDFVKDVIGGRDTDELQEAKEDELSILIDRGLFIPIAQEGERLCNASTYRTVFNDDVLAENKPTERPDFAEIAKNLNPPKTNSQNKGGGYKGGGAKQVTPQEKADFVKEMLKESGFDTSSLGSIVQQAMMNKSAWYTMQLATALASGTTLPTDFVENDIPTERNDTPVDTVNEDYIAKLKEWCNERKDDERYYGQKLDKVADGTTKLDEVKAKLLYNIVQSVDITKPDEKQALAKKLGVSFTAKKSLFDLDVETLSKA